MVWLGMAQIILHRAAVNEGFRESWQAVGFTLDFDWCEDKIWLFNWSFEIHHNYGRDDSYQPLINIRWW